MTFFPPSVDVATYRPEAAALKLLSHRDCERLRALPLCSLGETVLVAMADPFDDAILTELETLTRRAVEPVRATEAEISAAIARAYPQIVR